MSRLRVSASPHPPHFCGSTPGCKLRQARTAQERKMGMTSGDESTAPPSPLGGLADSLTSDARTWSVSPGLVSVGQVTPSGLTLLFRTARRMRAAVRSGGGGAGGLGGRTLATVFYEASTRTACSFQAAALRLGGRYEHVVGGSVGGGGGRELAEHVASAVVPGADAVVLRHPVQGSVGEVMEHVAAAAARGAASRTPVINAGDGTGEHPTQALLDLFTIWDELGLVEEESGGGRAKGEAKEAGSSTTAAAAGDSPPLGKRTHLVVVMLGDLKHGRTVHSLAKLLARAGLGDLRITLRYVSPPTLAMPQSVQDQVARYGHVTQEAVTGLPDALAGADVLYVTRVQRERFADPADYEACRGSYVVDSSLMEGAPAGTVVMHPLPRVDEISTDFDSDPRAAYFRQMENGMYVRMAILGLLLGEE